MRFITDPGELAEATADALQHASPRNALTDTAVRNLAYSIRRGVVTVDDVNEEADLINRVAAGAISAYLTHPYNAERGVVFDRRPTVELVPVQEAAFEDDEVHALLHTPELSATSKHVFAAVVRSIEAD